MSTMETERNEKTAEARTQKKNCTRRTINRGRNGKGRQNPQCHCNNRSGPGGHVLPLPAAWKPPNHPIWPALLQ